MITEDCWVHQNFCLWSFELMNLSELPTVHHFTFNQSLLRGVTGEAGLGRESNLSC